MSLFGIALDPSTHDLMLSDGMLNMVNDDDLLARNLKTRLQMLKGEWVLDNTYGFEYNVIFSSRILDLQLIETSLKNYILNTDGITKISVFKLDFISKNTRLLSLTVSVQTIFNSNITLGGLTIG